MKPSEIADNRTDLLTFSRTMFRSRKGAELKYNWHQSKICEALERVVIGQSKRLIINVPPRSGKTELAVKNFIAWCMGNFPDSEFIHASYSKRLASANTYEVRAIMLDEVYQQIFSHTELSGDSKAKDEFRTVQGGIVYSTGADGTITGYGAGKMRDTFGGCFAGHQMVQTNAGDLKIEDIVERELDVKVKSYCEESGNVRFSNISAFWKNPENDIIRIAMSDGSFIDCTPDHEILTDAGWVSAIHFAKALDLVNAKPRQSSGFASCKGSVISDFNDAFRVLWLCSPVGIRQMVSDRFPCLTGLDLPYDSDHNAVSLCEGGSAFAALEYFNNVFSGEFCPWSSLQNRECPMPESVLHIVGLGAIREIAKAVVGGVSVQMTNLIPIGAFTYKLLSDKVRDVFGLDDSANGEVDSKVTLPITRRLKKSDGLCPADLSSVRNLVQPECSRDVFPVGVYYAGHVSSTYCLEVECDNNFILAQSGAVVSNCIIIDDPHKAGEANSPIMRQNVIDWFQTTIESRKNSPDTPIIIIMQRLHEMDLSGFLLSGGNGEKWDHVCIAALDDKDETFWPGQFLTEDLHRQRASNSYVFAGQMMQQPAPIGGGIFKDAWWRYWQVMPELEYRMIYADTAMKTGEANDYSVLQCWGRTKDGKAIMLDQLRGKWEAPELLANARAFWFKHKDADLSVLRQMKVEDKASGTGLIQQLKREGVPVVGIPRDKDKVTRAFDAAPQIEAGNVLIPAAANWVSDFLAEASVFPNGQHDDQLDPMMDAVTDLLISRKEKPTIVIGRRR